MNDEYDLLGPDDEKPTGSLLPAGRYANEDPADLNAIVAKWQETGDGTDLIPHLEEWGRSLAVHAHRKNKSLVHDEDLKQDAIEWTLEQMTAWHPGEGNVRGFVSSRADWFVAARAMALSGMPSRSWRRVGAALAAVQKDFELDQVSPTLEQIRRGVEAKMSDGIRLNVTAAQPEIDSKSLAAIVEARMRKDGFAGALEQLTAIMESSGMAARLDAPTSDEDGAGVLGDRIAAPPSASSDPELDLDQFMRVVLGDSQWARQALDARSGSMVEGAVESNAYKTLSLQAKRPVGVIRTVVRTAQLRAAAPHAQWAHLASANVFALTDTTSMFADA